MLGQLDIWALNWSILEIKLIMQHCIFVVSSYYGDKILCFSIKQNRYQMANNMWHTKVCERKTCLHTSQSQAVRFWMAPAAASMETGLVQLLSMSRYSCIKSFPHSDWYSLPDGGSFGGNLHIKYSCVKLLPHSDWYSLPDVGILHKKGECQLATCK